MLCIRDTLSRGPVRAITVAREMLGLRAKMLTRGGRLLVATLLAVVCIAQRGNAAPQAMDTFVEEVLRQNPSVQARALVRQAFQREASANGLWPDPTAAVMLDNVPRRMDAEMPMLRYQLSQMIPWPGKLGLMREAALRRADNAAANWKQSRLELELEAKRAYLMLVRNARLREVNSASRGLVSTIVSTALARYGTGVGGHHDVSRAEVEKNALEVEAIDLRGERLAVVAMMNALRNAPADRSIADPKDVPEDGSVPPVAELVSLALARRPELEGMRAMQREEASMGALARRERYPDLMASVWYNQMLGAHDTVGMMVGASIPISGVTRQNRLAAAADLRSTSAGRDIEAMRAMIRFEVTDSWRKFVTASRSLEFLNAVGIPRAQESFLSSISGYSSGTVEIVGVLDAWRALLSVQRSRVELEVQRALALAELERAAAGRLHGRRT